MGGEGSESGRAGPKPMHKTLAPQALHVTAWQCEGGCGSQQWNLTPQTLILASPSPSQPTFLHLGL